MPNTVQSYTMDNNNEIKNDDCKSSDSDTTSTSDNTCNKIESNESSSEQLEPTELPQNEPIEEHKFEEEENQISENKENEKNIDHELTEKTDDQMQSETAQENEPSSGNASCSMTYINQCFEMETIAENENFSEPPPVAVLEMSSPIEIKNEPQPQSKRVITLPSIHIMDEFGQQTESISIDPNNNNSYEPAPQVEVPPDSAIVVKNVSFSYSKRNNILSDITLTVPKGKIYALLGSSGCGKTTLLRLILGRIQPRKGEIKVFGAEPGSIHSNVPGNGVGYMPQELALFPSFTIKETLYYYGRLHHMDVGEIEQKIDFLIELLNLPPKERKIEQCSGGQQRRASIATTMFHSPPLLILDEPTVGVDPLLRCKIWQYLEYLCLTNGMTVVITTHYIEESRNAGNLAFMRFGRILTQDSPDNLLQRFNCTILEDVFLKLCQHDCGEIKQKYSVKKKNIKGKTDSAEKDLIPVKSKFHDLSVDLTRLKALFFKNSINLKRNPLIFFFFLILPVVQIVLFCSSVFKTPDNLPISIYNGDNKGLSKRFLSQMDLQTLNVKYYNSHQEVLRTVISGEAWYGISIDKNFTKAYRRRAKNPSDLSDEDFDSSKIKLYVDTSDSFINTAIYNSLLNSYQDFVENVAESFGFNKATVRLPIFINEVVYGHYDFKEGYDLLNNLSSGALIAIIYTTPLIMAAFVIVIERKGSIIERTFVSGATSLEVFISHLISMMIALFIQVSLLMTVSFAIFEIRVVGSLVEVFILIYLQGMCGIMIGLLVSSISPNEIVALLLSLGMVFPVWMMCGVFWPLESITEWLQDIFWCMPLSYPIRSIDHIIKRGWSFEYHEVQIGYYVSMIYNTVLLMTNIIVFHITSK